MRPVPLIDRCVDRGWLRLAGWLCSRALARYERGASPARRPLPPVAPEVADALLRSRVRRPGGG